MNVETRFVLTATVDSIIDAVNSKFKSLEQQLGPFNSAEVFFREKWKNTDENRMLCDILLSRPGPGLYTEAAAPTFEDAFEFAFRDLKKMLVKKE